MRLIYKFYCILSNYKYVIYDLERHYKSKLHERNGKAKTTKCDEYDYSLITHWLIKKHKIAHHSIVEERQKQKYYCSICDVVFLVNCIGIKICNQVNT